MVRSSTRTLVVALALLAVTFIAPVFAVSPKTDASVPEIKLADIESIRLLSPNNLPIKVLVVASWQSQTVKFVANLVRIVAKIHELDGLRGADSFKVMVFGAFQETFDVLEKELGKDTMKRFVEQAPLKIDSDVWMQDWGEIGTVKLRGEEKPRLLILDANRSAASMMFYEGGLVGPALTKSWNACYLKNPSQQPRGGDMGGNIEVTPCDVLVVGNTITPEFRELFAKCGYRDRMIEVEADWLTVGHCDEYLSIVPNDKTGEGFTLVKGDPALALKLVLDADREEIENIQLKEYREQMLFLYDYLHSDHESAKRWVSLLRAYEPYSGYAGGQRFPRITFAGAMNTPEKFSKTTADLFIRQNLALAGVIDQNVDKLCDRINQVHRLGSRAHSIISFPMLYGKKNNRYLGYLPGVINQLILRKHLVIADPKMKLFRDSIRASVARFGLTPHFIDDTPYHKLWGDVHCATNVLRDPDRYIVRPKHLGK